MADEWRPAPGANDRAPLPCRSKAAILRELDGWLAACCLCVIPCPKRASLELKRSRRLFRLACLLLIAAYRKGNRHAVKSREKADIRQRFIAQNQKMKLKLFLLTIRRFRIILSSVASCYCRSVEKISWSVIPYNPLINLNWTKESKELRKSNRLQRGFRGQTITRQEKPNGDTSDAAAQRDGRAQPRTARRCLHSWRIVLFAPCLQATVLQTF